ncbi:hypothetical protein J2Y45_006065 [Dyadobacter sp. BE34]|uniref:Uncharacterized protein n=1 Tax=Dyadobacter fermentans TaxID=94254 RepID=A0ABU1R620_9BACT|nr:MULTISPECIES: hypothetical protein [Dyadobacter]MDR6808852.1 hypothetical protein [Dyadobacter fermentans]MDR7046595.1 hypothetical protein [Dyadobacter sp. BE242]MDR7200908.1 hypothetical protein [Dyadobacter sp. BE34]MDR7218869.1 hypothetical protein [Dyadobacter sp. BE31]MDR7264921.1 hypothetical protein [Dyadobacter sp. BE32]
MKVTILQAATAASLIVISVPVYLYYQMFGSLELSHDLEIWAHFSDFFTLWLSVVSLIMIFALTYYVSVLESNREKERQKLEDARNRPILVLQVDSANYKVVKNIGIGPALNPRVTIKNTDGTYLSEKVLPPIMAGESQKVNLMALFNTDWPVVCFIYQDIYGNDITTETDEKYSVRIFVGRNELRGDK